MKHRQVRLASALALLFFAMHAPTSRAQAPRATDAAVGNWVMDGARSGLWGGKTYDRGALYVSSSDSSLVVRLTLRSIGDAADSVSYELQAAPQGERPSQTWRTEDLASTPQDAHSEHWSIRLDGAALILERSRGDSPAGPDRLVFVR